VRKRLTKVRYRGRQVAIISLFLLVFLAIVSVSPQTSHAALIIGPLPFATTPTPVPTQPPTPVPTQPPTPTAQPQPTTTPATPAPAPTTTAATPAPVQQTPGAGAAGAASNQAPTPTLTVSPTPAATSPMPGATTANAPASTQQEDMSSPLDAVFSPVGVTLILLSVLAVAGVVLLLMRRKQPAPALADNAMQGAAVDYAPFTPVPQALSQTAPPAMTPMPAMTQRVVLPSSEPGQLSLDPHSEVTEMQEVVLAPSQMPAAAAMPSALPETPSLHRGDPSEQEHIDPTDPVSTNQLMAIIRQAQAGLFVIPERGQEKQTR
jgi:hypothetical protein